MIKSQEILTEFDNKIDLNKEYEKCLKDEDFKNFVSKFKLPREEMIKHTSNLENSSLEYNHCLNCSGLHDCLNEIKGFAYLPKVVQNTLVFRYKACRYYEKEKQKIKHVDYVKTYNMPKNVIEANFDKIDKRYSARREALNWLTEFKNNYPNVTKGLYLHGSFGGGKSYLITALFNELAKKKVKSMIIFYSEFLQELKSSFDSDFADRLQNVKTVPLLLIDDIGAEAVTQWSRDEILCSILQYRMDEKKPTFFTSNLNLEELEDHLSLDGKEKVKAKRIIERIKFLTDEIQMNSVNLRK